MTRWELVQEVTKFMVRCKHEGIPSPIVYWLGLNEVARGDVFEYTDFSELYLEVYPHGKVPDEP